VLKKGEVEEYGSPKELLKKKGVYYHLYNLQAGNPSQIQSRTP